MATHPKYDEGMMGERLRFLAQMAGYEDLAKFARAAGVEPGTAQKQANRDSIPIDAGALYIEAAKGTGADLNWLLTGKGSRPTLRLQSREKILRFPIMQNPTSLPVDADAVTPVPLWKLYPADRRVGVGASVLIARSDDTIPGPGELKTAKAAFALYVWDDENAPWLRRGWTLFVDPAQVPGDGHWSVFSSEVLEGGQTFYRPYIAILLSVAGTNWRIQRGAHKSTLSMAEWPLAWKVVYIKQT